MFHLRIAIVVVTTIFFGVDWYVSEKTGGESSGTVTAAWLLALGWLFGGGVHEAVKQRNNGRKDKRDDS